MVKREKVLIGLTCCGNLDSWSDKICERCPYNHDKIGYFGCEDHLVADALALLKEQEPRVITLEEIRSGAVEVVWIEDADKAEVIPGIWFRLSNEGEDEAVDIHIRDGFVGARLAVYGKLWRCWTARPTEKQRKAVAWDG